MGGPDKALHIPDVALLASIAENAGLDLRVVVLLRDAEELLRSTVVTRAFGPEKHQAVVLSLAATALAGQLQLIDSRFIIAVNTSELGFKSAWTRRAGMEGSLQDTLAIDDKTVDAVVAELLTKQREYAAQKRAAKPPPKGLVVSALTQHHLAARLDLLEAAAGVVRAA